MVSLFEAAKAKAVTHLAAIYHVMTVCDTTLVTLGWAHRLNIIKSLVIKTKENKVLDLSLKCILLNC